MVGVGRGEVKKNSILRVACQLSISYPLSHSHSHPRQATLDHYVLLASACGKQICCQYLLHLLSSSSFKKKK